MEAGIGHNQPPTDAELLKTKIEEGNKETFKRADDLNTAFDRMPKTITNDEEKDKVTLFLAQIAKCDKDLEALRVKEKEPYLTLERTVDNLFKTYKLKLKATVQKVKPILDARLLWEREEERKRIATEAADRKRLAEAQAAAAAALEEINGAKATELLDEAIQNESHANRLGTKATGKISVIARASNGASASMRTTIKAEEVDRDALDLNLLRHHFSKDAVQAALNSLVKSGVKECAGARIWEHSESVIRG